MQRAPRRTDQRDGTGTASPRLALADLFDGFVSLDIDCAAERRVQARVVGALVAAGLVCAAASPFTFIAGSGPQGILAPTLVGAALLASAAAISATGRLNSVAAVLTLCAATAATAAIAAGGAPALAGALGLFPVVAGAAWLARRWAALRPARTEPPATSPWSADDIAARRLTGPVLRFDAAGNLLRAPDALQALFGPLEGRFVEAIHVSDRVAFLNAFADLRRGGGDSELEIRLPGEGGLRHLRLRLAAVPGAQGEIACVLGLVQDLTPDREASREMALTLTRAENESEAKSRYLAAISHELRTPLNAIIGFTDILEREFFGGFQDARQKEYVGLIGRSGEHLLQVVNGLLDLSKIEAGRYELARETFDAREALEAAAAMVRAQADAKGVLVIVQEPEDGAQITGDRRALHQVLLNLVSNAVKFTDEGCVRLSARREGPLQIVEVEDSGIGIAPSDLPRLARPFTRVGGADGRPGTGLGLSIARGLCELHRGTLTIDSRLGIGTTAVVAIPEDGVAVAGGEDILKEKIVSLNDARKKPVLAPQAPTDRRSA